MYFKKIKILKKRIYNIPNGIFIYICILQIYYADKI